MAGNVFESDAGVFSFDLFGVGASKAATESAKRIATAKVHRGVVVTHGTLECAVYKVSGNKEDEKRYAKFNQDVHP